MQKHSASQIDVHAACTGLLLPGWCECTANSSRLWRYIF